MPPDVPRFILRRIDMAKALLARVDTGLRDRDAVSVTRSSRPIGDLGDVAARAVNRC
jgi:hypothetical protein